MYQIKCDDYPLLDLRDDELIVESPKVKLEVNTAGSGSFTIYKEHPYFDKLNKLKSVVEISDEIGAIFRGRITDDTIDFENGKAVALEGAMAYFNDSIIRPYAFPDDFLDDADYIEASENGNTVAFFLNWLIGQHNSQVQDFQKFKLGEVTVADANNYITRSDSSYQKTWDVLKSKLFNSALGGYLCIRYEDDGNYIDYLSEFTLTNTQPIVFGENLLDLKSEVDASDTFTAMIPLGADVDTTTAEGTTKSKLTIASLPDGDITDDIVKVGDTIFSTNAVAQYGWIYAKPSEATWKDVTEAENLLTKGVNALVMQGIMLLHTMTIKGVDLHFTDKEIQSFRIYRNILVQSLPHNHDAIYRLTKLDIDLLNPQKTKITVGMEQATLTDINNSQQTETITRIEIAEKDIAEIRESVTEVNNQFEIQRTQILNTCNEIILGALETYVETSDYEAFKSTVESQLVVMSDEIAASFKTTTEQIENVDGDLQKKFEEVYKHISFSDDGITIKSSDNAITLQLDNEEGIIFSKNGIPFGTWDGTNFHTGNIVIDVEEKAQFGNYAFVPRSDGSLSFLKVGG